MKQPIYRTLALSLIFLSILIPQDFAEAQGVSIDDVSGVDHMMISNHPDFSDAYWEPYKTPRDWGMTGSTVYVKFRDKAGNISIW